MREKIEPALTPEEWASQREGRWVTESVAREHGGFGAGELRHDLFTRMWYDSVEGVRVTVEQETGYEEDITIPHAAYHALAALCLHGQPFGFTREMAAALEMCVRNFDGVDIEDAQYHEGAGDLAREAIARIAALLPPE